MLSKIARHVHDIHEGERHLLLGVYLSCMLIALVKHKRNSDAGQTSNC